jgi:NOL1/NOP2/fmu family ribosome biogenesis protein
MATKGVQKKAPDGSAYQKEINSWTSEDLNSKLNDCEKNLHLDLAKQDKRQEIFKHLATKWLPATPDRDDNDLPIDINKEDLDRMLVNQRKTVNIAGYMLARAELLEISKTETRDINGDPMSFERRIKRWRECYKAIVNKFIENDTEFKLFNQPMAQNADVDFDVGEAASPYQNLLIYLLRTAYKNGFRRYRDQCCKEIGNTRAWKTVKEIKDFVYDETQKEDNAEMWMNLTNRGGMANDVIRHLMNCKDIQFAEIKKDRHVWSFQNGLLDARPIDENRDTETGIRKFTFYEYTAPEFAELDPSLVSCKYFDLPFASHDDVSDWYDIPTPNMQCVLDYQKFEESVCRWVYVFMGRLCFDVNELDGWQVIPFLKGIAQSGKSTLITKVARKFYECEDVAVLSNNIEKKFGLQSIHKGFVFISPEIKGDLQLEQAEFQSMVSGEDVSVARKNEAALSMQWKTPGILGGNEVPNWKDNSGSILRRLATVNFSRQIAPDVADPHLDDKLELEMPAILCKCLRAYLEYSSKYADKDIWNVLPKYFKQVQNQVATVTNSLQHFLCSEKFSFGKDLFIPQKIFVAQFNQHCRENNLGTFRFNPDFYAGPFSSKELEVRIESKIYQGQAFSTQPIIYGLDLKIGE